MPNCGSTKFTEADDYQASARGGVSFNLVFNCQKDFKARLTWLKLRHLFLLRGQETLPRVAHIALTPEQIFIALPSSNNPPIIYDGVEVRRGDLVFHSLGDRTHQLTRGPSEWGYISLAPEHLASWAKVLTGSELTPSAAPRILQPYPRDAAHLSQLHAAACRLVESKSEIIGRPEVARAIEQDILRALVNCLVCKDARNYSASNRRHADIVARLESVFAQDPERNMQMLELCAAVGAPERTLRACCTEFFGMSPHRYILLRRLNMVHTELRRSPAESVEKVARRYGFSELGRFAALYQDAIGKLPSATLRDARTGAA